MISRRVKLNFTAISPAAPAGLVRHKRVRSSHLGTFAGLALLLALALMLVASPGLAQDAQNVDAELPQSLIAGIDEMGNEYPELLDLSWALYTDRDVSMWLPDSYEQPLIEDMLALIDERAALLSEDLIPLIKAIANSPDLFRFAAFDLPTMESGFMSNVIVTRDQMMFAFPALTVANAMQTMLPDVMTNILAPVEYELEGYDAAYTELRTESLIGEAINLQYYVVDESYLYVVTFSTAVDEHEYARAISRLAINTFVIERDEDE